MSVTSSLFRSIRWSPKRSAAGLGGTGCRLSCSTSRPAASAGPDGLVDDGFSAPRSWARDGHDAIVAIDRTWTAPIMALTLIGLPPFGKDCPASTRADGHEDLSQIN